MYKITGKCLCGGNIIKADESINQCMKCFIKDPAPDKYADDTFVVRAKRNKGVSIHDINSMANQGIR